MGKRNRGSMALSVEGKEIVRAMVNQKGWTQDVWASEGFVSVATAKRLLNGVPIESRCFHSLLQALGLEIHDRYIHKQPGSTSLISSVSQEFTLSQDQPGVFMTATFTKNNLPQIERAMHHLQNLLVGGEVTFAENGGAVTVSGDFCEENKEHIQLTITQLEKLFTSCKITW